MKNHGNRFPLLDVEPMPISLDVSTHLFLPAELIRFGAPLFWFHVINSRWDPRRASLITRYLNITSKGETKGSNVGFRLMKQLRLFERSASRVPRLESTELNSPTTDLKSLQMNECREALIHLHRRMKERVQKALERQGNCSREDWLKQLEGFHGRKK